MDTIDSKVVLNAIFYLHLNLEILECRNFAAF